MHWVLPFTPVNPHPGAFIRIGSIVLGAGFLVIGLLSIRNPRPWFGIALGLLLLIYALSAITGASPLQEGWPIKALIAGGLAWGLLKAKTGAAA
jgi:hypothetical protein